MPMAAADIERMICAALPGAQVTIRDLAGDGDHYAAHVVAPQFAAVNRVQQHKLVYAALGELMDGAIHALALKTTAETP